MKNTREHGYVTNASENTQNARRAMKQTSGRFPLELLYDKRLDANDRLIAVCAYSFANWRTGEAYFSMKGLCLRSGIKDSRTVRARLKNLEKHGWLTIDVRPGKRSLYTLRPLTADEGAIEEHVIERNNSSYTHTRSKLIASNALASASCAREKENHGKSGIGGVHGQASGEVQSLPNTEAGSQHRVERRVDGDAWEIVARIWGAGYSARG